MWEKIAFGAFVWVMASLFFCGYWSILRKQDKRRSAELMEYAKTLEEKALALQTQLQCEALTPGDRANISLSYERLIRQTNYWRTRAYAWAGGDY
jgi:hypothetical protein